MENIYFNKKRYFTVLLILTLLLCSFVLIGLNKKSNNSYAYPDCNVILISIDALRPDHLGCYGYHRNTSPYIDKLAQKSIVFENAFSHIPRTLSSHMTMLTSLYPSVHGIVQPQDESPVPTLPDSIITLPQILKKEGYATGNFTFLPGECGFHKGFNMIVQEDLLTGYSFRTEEMFQWIEDNKDNKFFLFFHTYVAHAPYMSEYSARFTGKKYDIDLYDGAILYGDEKLSLLFKKLEELNIYKRTIIIITADHGEEFYDHGGHGHGVLYVEHLHVPLIIKLPDNFYRRIQHDVGLIDLTPTILELLGIRFKPKKYSFQGFSLVSLLKGASFERAIYCEIDNSKKFSLKTKEWKYIGGKGSKISDGAHLYNVNADPHEKNDLIDALSINGSQYPHIVDSLYEQAMQIQEKNRNVKAKVVKKLKKAKLNEDTIERMKALGYIN